MSERVWGSPTLSPPEDGGGKFVFILKGYPRLSETFIAQEILALEQRGFESLWAPEHSHIPLSRKSPFPGGGDLPKRYYDAMDPFVTLTAAAAATKTLMVGTGVCLVAQRDPIQTAKLVASVREKSLSV